MATGINIEILYIVCVYFVFMFVLHLAFPLTDWTCVDHNEALAALSDKGYFHLDKRNTPYSLYRSLFCILFPCIYIMLANVMYGNI